MPRMRQINTTATDLLRGNVRQEHYSVIIGRENVDPSFFSFVYFFGKSGGRLKNLIYVATACEATVL